MEPTRVYAYLRKSTDDQNTKSQELSVYEYANKQGWRIDEWFDVDCSSGKSTKERRIDELLGVIKEGDTLIVPELSRLGRSVGQVVMIVDELIKKLVLVFQSRFLAKARPEGLLRYFSKSRAFCRSPKATAVFMRQGLYFEV